jgi:hypothetical protein
MRDGYGGSGYRGAPYAEAPGGGGAGRRGAMVAIVIVFVLVVLGGVAYGAVRLASRGGDTGSAGAAASASTEPSGSAAGPGSAPATDAASTAGQPATTSAAPTTAHRLTGPEVRAKVRALGYVADLSTFDGMRALNAVIGSKTVASGDPNGAGTRAQLAFVFSDTTYLGTDTKQPSHQIKVVMTTNSYVILEYGTFAAADPDCCPSGTKRVRYNWDGTALTPQNAGEIPTADPTADDSRR